MKKILLLALVCAAPLSAMNKRNIGEVDKKVHLSPNKRIKQQQQQLSQKAFEAVCNDQVNKVALLLLQGADANYYSLIEDQTLLHRAAENDNAFMVDLLLQHGANAFQPNSTGRTAVYTAVEVGSVNVVSYFLEQNTFFFNARDFDNQTGLFCAASYGHVDICKLFIEKINTDTSANSAELSAELISAFHCAAENCHSDVLEFLLGQGLDVNSVDGHNTTALHFAMINNYEDLTTQTVKLLIEHGAQSDMQDTDGNTPLHYTALEGNDTIVRLLVELGADVNIRNNNSFTAVVAARAAHNDSVVAYLESFDCFVESPDTFIPMEDIIPVSDLNVIIDSLDRAVTVLPEDSITEANFRRVQLYPSWYWLKVMNERSTYGYIDLNLVYATLKKSIIYLDGKKTTELEDALKGFKFAELAKEERKSLVKSGMPLTVNELTYKQKLSIRSHQQNFADVFVDCKK